MSAQPTIPSDIEIAQAAKLRHISDVAAEIGLGVDDIDLYGKYKAKIPLEISRRPVKGRLVRVTAVNPTPACEGKSTVTVGLTQALRKLGKNAMLCMREPSLGPVFGVMRPSPRSTARPRSRCRLARRVERNYACAARARPAAPDSPAITT